MGARPHTLTTTLPPAYSGTHTRTPLLQVRYQRQKGATDGSWHQNYLLALYYSLGTVTGTR